MLRERKAKRVDFERMKRLSRPRGLAWGPHARKLDRAKTKHKKQQTSDVSWWHHATFVPCAINCFVVAIVRIFWNFSWSSQKGAIFRVFPC